MKPVYRYVNSPMIIHSKLSDMKKKIILILIGKREHFIPWIGNYPLDEAIHSSYNRAQVSNLQLS